MSRRSSIARTLVLITLLSPSALASWAVKGAYEPDTVHDLGGWMYTDPDVDPAGRRLYFNGFGAPGGPATTALNPNAATLQTSITALPFLPLAMLGVWKDCNADGYVGLSDQGLVEYSSVLLLDDSICPPAIPDPERPWRTHNDGSWVVEMIPVGYDDVTTPEDENVLAINDTAARVWADWGLPGDAPMLTCATFPTPYGTFRSTGGLLRWTDCYSGHRLVPAASSAFETAGTQELSFNDAPADRPDLSGSALNVANPWGRESDAPLASAFDCSDPEEIVVEDPTEGMLRNLATIPVPGGPTIYVNGTDAQGRIINATSPTLSPRIDPSGSPAGAVNDTEAGLTDCDRDNAGEIVDIDGHIDGSDADAPYALEGNNEPISSLRPRTRTDHVFSFEEGTRGGSALAIALGARTRDDAGLGTLALTGLWVGVGAAIVGPNPYVGRSDIAAASVTYITYYAHVSPHILTGGVIQTPSGVGFYGAEGCSRIPATFECNEELWWRNSLGEDITPRDDALGEDPDAPTQPEQGDHTKIGVRVWQAYRMRDIDCIDTSFSPARELGAHWGALTATACARP